MEGSLVKAVYCFQKEADTDLNLSIGDIIKVTEKINDDWYKGLNGNETGQFPAAFVEVVLENAPNRVFVAIADFVAQTDEDISFAKDEYVAFEADVDDNWFTGRTKKSSGLCPKSFVKEVYFAIDKADRIRNSDIINKQTAEESPYGESVDSFSAQGSDELSFPKGVKLELTKEIDSFWTEGIYNGHKGKFPSMFVKVVIPLPDSLKFKESEDDAEKEKPLPNAKALFMYIGAGTDELSFDKGDIITLSRRINAEWFKGNIGNTEGIFPASYVKVIVDLPFEEQNSQSQSPLENSLRKTTNVTNQSASNVRAPDKDEKGQHRKPALKPKPTLKEKPVLVKPSNTTLGNRPGPLLLTSRKQPSKTATTACAEQAITKDGSDDKVSFNATEGSFQRQTKGPTIIRAAREKPTARQSSPKPQHGTLDLASSPSLPPPIKQVSKSITPKPQTRSSFRKKKPAKMVSIEHSMPLLQDSTVNSKLSRPARPLGLSPSPNTKLLEKELDANNFVTNAEQTEAANSKFFPSDKAGNVSSVNATTAGVDDKQAIVSKRTAPKRPSKCPSKSTSSLPTVKTNGQASPKLQPSAVTKGSNTLNRKQDAGAMFVDKSRSLPPRLPKPLAPLPPQKPVAPRSPKPGQTDAANVVSSNNTLQKSPAPQITANGRFYLPSLSADVQDVVPEECPQNTRNSMFYVDCLDSVDGTNGSRENFELETVEKRIVQIRGQIESEANILSGIETLLEVSEDDNKKNELLFKQRSLSVSLLDLDEELNACQDEKSYLLASYGDVAAIKSRIQELSDLIDQYQDNSAKLRKMKDVSNIDELAEIRDGIEFCDNMIETLLEEMTSLRTEMEKQEPVVNEPVKEDPAETRRKLLDQRQKAITELIKTEKDYVRDIDLCSTKILSRLKEYKNIDCDVLFGNLVVISNISKKLLESFEKIEQEQDSDNSVVKQIGQCFTELSFDLKSEYSCYCHNYDDSQVLLEKLEQDTEKREEILTAVAAARGETGLWDLSSYLIKPVQRILKYPLILQEIFKYSPDDDEDRGCIQDAISILKNVATAINEFKRRKDLVQKYQRDEGIGNRIQRLNWHSVRKKSSRINQKITQFTGLVSQTVDEAFNEEEKRFKAVEKMIKSFVRNLSLYLEYFQENCSLQITVAEDVKAFCMEAPNLDEVESLCNVILRIRDVLCPEFIAFVKTRVFDPLESLLHLFQSPTKLIEKRQDKCLDYDRILNRVQKLKEKEKQKQENEELALSRKIYEALNSQLLEELPQLSEKCLKFFDYCLANLVQARCSYLQKITEDLKLCLQLHLVECCSTAEIIQKHGEAISIADEKLSQLVFSPERSLPSDGSIKPEPLTLPREPASNFYIDLLYDPNEGDPTSPIKPVAGDRTDLNEAELEKPKPQPRRKSLRGSSNSSNPASPLKSSVLKSFDSPDGHKSVLSPTENSNLYVAKYTFEKENDAEISVDEGSIVDVIRKSDKDGNSEWWLIETSNGRGYVPALYLSSLSNNDDCQITASDISYEAAALKQGGFGLEAETLTQISLGSTANEKAEISIGNEGQSELFVCNGEPSNDADIQPNSDNVTEDSPTVSTSKADSGVLYKAIYDFEASDSGECSLTEGATVRLIKLGDVSGNCEWSQIECDGKSGYVPTNYLEPIVI